MLLNAEVRVRLRKKRTLGRKVRQKVQAELVIAPAVKIKEVLGEVKQLAASHVDAEFFLHLARDSGGCLLTHFDAPAGQRPEVVTRCSVQQHMPAIADDRGRTNLKALTLKVEGEHETWRLS